MGSANSKKGSGSKSPSKAVEEEQSATMEEQTHKKHVKFTLPDPNVEDICSQLDDLELVQDDDNDANEEPPKNNSEDTSSEEEEANPSLSPSSSGASPEVEESKPSPGEESSDEEDTISGASADSQALMKELEVPEECTQGESVIVEYRAKLFRFRAEKKQWIEKGLGKITLLQSLSDRKKCRVVMWRDGNGLLACNFALFSELNVDNFQSNPKALVWKCQECNLEWETYSCRFKSEEECADFKTKLIQYSKDPPEVSHVISLLADNKYANAEGEAEGEKVEAVTYGAGAGVQEDEETTCAGCRGCESSGFEFPKPAEVKEDEHIINCALGEDACNDLPSVVSPTMFN